MKKLVISLLMIAIVLSSTDFSAFAGSANVAGFPLPAKSTPYSVNVLGRYSDGTTHMLPLLQKPSIKIIICGIFFRTEAGFM